MLPVMRDPDGGVYFREWGGGLCAGGVEELAKLCFYDRIPENFEFQLLPDDWDHFGMFTLPMIKFGIFYLLMLCCC